MCGIVGLYLKNDKMTEKLGAYFEPMLIGMSGRGSDSAGIAIYNNLGEDGVVKMTVFHPDLTFDWDELATYLSTRLGTIFRTAVNASHCILRGSGQEDAIVDAIEAYDPLLQVMSHGQFIEIYKETGTPLEVTTKFDLSNMGGTHIIGHTRMATESAVTTDGSHPFSTGPDLCLVHNGSLSNHNRLRDYLRNHKGMRIRTENDTEVGAAYVASRLKEGRTLAQAFEDCLDALDGFYTFVAGTKDGFAVLRDPIACKPAVLAETDDYVAFASEYHALTDLPDINHAKVWEPEPATVYSWGSEA